MGSHFINIIIRKMTERLSRKTIPTVGVEAKSLEWGFHPTYWGDHGDEGDLDEIAPLRTKTITYNLVCEPQDHEAIVEAIAGEFRSADLYKLINVELTQPTTIKWSAHKGQAITLKGVPTITITWSEDIRLAP